MGPSASVAPSHMTASPLAGQEVRPYAPSWLHSLVAFVERLPGPSWVVYVVTWVVATLLWHAQVWSNGQVALGAFDRTSAFWGFLAPALLWSAAYMERVAAAAFDAFRPALTIPAEESAGLRYALIVLPARPALTITILAVLLTGADIAFSGSPNYAGLPLPMLVLSFVVQSVYVSVMFQLLYRLIRQTGLVRRTLATSVAIDIFRPGPLNAFATLTSRPGAVLTLVVASSLLAVPLPSDLGGYLVGWAPYVVVPPVIAAIAFIVPLTGVHAALVEQKERLLDAAGLRLQAVLQAMDRDVEAGDLARADAWNKTLANLQAERQILASLPTWPWSTATLRGFVSAVLLPLALFVVQVIIGRLI